MALKILSKTYESGAKVEGLTLTRAIGFLTITVFGIFANVLNLELHFGVNFIFGSIFTMIAIRYYGAALGAVVAFIVSIYTIKLWGHPYAVIIFTFEALFVGYFAHKPRKTNYLTLDLAYWLLVGGPLVWIFYGRFLDIPADSTLLIFTKQTVNGLTNVAIASLIVMLLPVGRILSGYKTAPKEMFSLAFAANTVLAIFTLGPAIFISMIANQNAFEREKQAQIDVSAHHVITAASSIEDTMQINFFQATVQLSKARHENRLQEFIANEPNILAVAVFDQSGERNWSAGDLETYDLDQLSETAISRVFENPDVDRENIIESKLISDHENQWVSAGVYENSNVIVIVFIL